MEGYPGAVILATNYRRNIDDAFVRRLDFVIDAGQLVLWSPPSGYMMPEKPQSLSEVSLQSPENHK